MLESKCIEAGVLSGARCGQKRRLAFAESGDVRRVKWRKKFAIAPDTALIDRVVGRAPGAPGSFQAGARRSGIGFEEPTTARAGVDHLIDTKSCSTIGVETN